MIQLLALGCPRATRVGEGFVLVRCEAPETGVTPGVVVSGELFGDRPPGELRCSPMAYLADYSDVLTQAQRRVWGRMAAIASHLGGSLRGETACAIHLRHRRPRGLAIVTPEPFRGHSQADYLEHIFTDVQFVNITGDSCEAVVEGAHVGLFAVPDDPRVATDIVVCGMPVASVPDLMVTMMEAVRFRRELCDHIDLHAMDTLSDHTLVDGIGFWCRRYGHDRPPPDLDDIIECLADPGHLRDDPALGDLRGEALAHLRIQAAAMSKHATALRSLPAPTEREGSDEHYDSRPPAAAAPPPPSCPQCSRRHGPLPDHLADYHPSARWCDTVASHKREGRYAEALAILEKCMRFEEAQHDGVAPWCYQQAAIINRKINDRDAELAVLRRFESQRHHAGALPPKLLDRLYRLESADAPPRCQI